MIYKDVLDCNRTHIRILIKAQLYRVYTRVNFKGTLKEARLLSTAYQLKRYINIICILGSSFSQNDDGVIIINQPGLLCCARFVPFVCQKEE